MRSLLETKSFWMQVLAGVAQVLMWAGVPGLNEWLVANPEGAMMIAGGIQAVVAWVVRLVTKEPVTVLPQ